MSDLYNSADLTVSPPPHPSAARPAPPVHRAFEVQAARTPEATALRLGNGSWSYAELDRRANQVAHALRDLGVGPEVLVGLHVERSFELLAGILGILKAGGAYVPLDPEYPRARLELVLADAAIPVVLTQPHLLRRLGADGAGGARWLRLDFAGGTGDGLGGRPESRPPLHAGPESPAYVLYTSGSTGRPKGVVVGHRALANHMRWMLEAWPPAADDVVLQRTSTSFDASVWELFLPLMGGVPLVLAPPGAQGDTALLAALIAERSVTVLQCVPTLLAALLDEPGFVRCRSLRRVYCGGEALPRELVRRFQAASAARLVNLYGPTEATIDATWWSCGEGEEGAVPIGRPIAGMQAFVVDPEGDPAPPGAAGELLLGGPGLARGYLGRPELTAERFVPHPWAEEEGERLYRTGDLARERADGALDYLGRGDHQVKVRGQRIELGEVEEALRRLPGVRQAVAAAPADERGERRLVGYVVLAAGDGPDGEGAKAGGDAARVETLRRALAADLPAALVPTGWVLLPALPLAPNGKVDRAALPPCVPSLADGAEAVAPQPGLETEIAAIFGEVLGWERVGAEDDFFALGGHSLSAVRVVSRLRARLGAELPARALFEHPTVRRLAQAVDLLPLAGDFGWKVPPLPRPEQEAACFEASFGQQRLWVADRYSPARALYNTPYALDLDGPLDQAALEGALNAVLRRHEALRTVFRFAGDTLEAVVAREPERALPRVDLSALPAAASASERRRVEGEEARRPFDLGRGPVARFLLLRRSRTEHSLLVLVHHIAFDDWSAGLLLRELARFYPACRGVRRLAVPALPLQVADLAAWQRRRLDGERAERGLAWWRSHLAPPLPLLDLPADRPRPALRSFRGGVWRSFLPRQQAARLDALAALPRGGASPFMVLLALFAVLLRRHAEAESLVVGTPVANRGRSEAEELIGSFVNTLALRLDLGGAGGGPAFRELLGRVRELLLDAYSHQDLPFERVLEGLGQPRDPARSPLFDVMLVLANTPPPPDALEPGLAAAWREVHTGTAKLDLTLFAAPRAGGLELVWEYAADLFDAGTVAAWSRRFAVLLAACAADPDAPLARLPLLAAEEIGQLRSGWRFAACSWEGGTSLPELFARQVALGPERPAVACAGTVWSYRQLDEHSNRLARRLRALGVGFETRVGVCVERSAELVALLLAVQKAGGAYVPLDPSHPAERLAGLLADSAAEVLVTERALRDRLPVTALPLAACLLLDEEGADLAVPGADLDAPLAPLDDPSGARLAYLIYTSGSTGRPKGVGVPQRALANFLRAMAERPGCGAGARIPALTTVSFDIAGLELYLPLTTGGRVDVLARHEAMDGALLAARLRATGATLLQATPATFRLLLDSGWRPDAGAAGPLRVLCGGEALPRDLAAELLALGVELWNVYGPTETTVWSSAGRVEPGDLGGDGRGAIGLGTAIANTRLYVADRAGELAPDGVPGELWIGGQGVARGYQGRPELTAERFVPDPWSEERGARAYRTGDLVRRRPRAAAGVPAGPEREVALEYLGRIDDQVKVRGFRIELGEVEAALAASGETAAVVAAGEGADRFLAAFLVRRNGMEPDAEELRRRLRERLPEYMVPTAWCSLDRLPLTPNGKVDRRELARRAAGEASAGGPGTPDAGPQPAPDEGPRNPVEELLAALFAAELERPAVGLRDDFFLLGGHSLPALRVLQQVREAMGVELPLAALFEAPTVEALAYRIEAHAAGRDHGEALPLAAQPRAAEMPLSFAQERAVLREALTGGNVAPLSFAVSIRGALDPNQVEEALCLLVARHEPLRTRFRPAAEAPARWIQAVLPPETAGLPATSRVDLTAFGPARAESAAAERMADEGLRPLDLATGPPFRTLLLVLAPGSHRLAVSLHPVVADRESPALLFRDLSHLLAAVAARREPGLPPLPLQLADFALCQRRWMSGPLLARQLAAARERLHAAPLALDLPTDLPRPARRTRGTGVESLVLGDVRELAFEELYSRTSATGFLVVLAAFQALLARFAGQSDFLLGSPHSGRESSELGALAGPLANPLVVRADLRGDPTFAALLVRTRSQALAAFSARALPFEKLAAALGAEEDPSAHPVFQVLFAQERLPEPPCELLPGISLSLSHLPAGDPLLDLALGVVEEEGAVRGVFRYARDLFAATTVRRFAGHLRALLRAAAARPEAPLSALPLLSAAERHQLLVDWNPETPEPPWPGTVEEQLRAWALRAPQRPAVRLGERSWSHAQLDRRAEEIARALAARGVGPGAVVAVLLDRSFDLLATLVAVLRTGAAYLPIDPAMRKYNNAQSEAPAADNRFVFMLSSAGARFVVTADLYRRSLPEGAWEWIAIEGLGAGTDPSEARDWPAGAPAGLAYVMFTSGSTGLPKGLGIPHAAQVRHARAIAGDLGLGPGDRALQYASMGFDVSGEEIWPTLMAGGAVVLVEDPQDLPPRALSALVASQGLTVLNLPSPYWEEWLDHLGHAGERLPGGLRQVIVGSDAVSCGRLAQWQALVAAAAGEGGDAAAPCGWRHAYGLTETTVTSTLYRPQDGFLPRRGLPIGRPLPGVRAYVVDREGEPVPLGVPGELWLGGELLAQGCLTQPGVTAALFTPDPFAPAGCRGARVCQTGDLARRLPDGNLEFLGRIESQIRLGGRRIEPGDVEAALERDPGVGAALVMAVEQGPEVRLQAFVVPATPPDDAEAAKREILAAVRELLPLSMVPAALHLLERLPTSENGKFDRRRLAALAETGSGAERIDLPPESLVERELASLWREVLRLEWVGAQESFWNLGGHSLLATRMLGRVAQHFGVELPLQALFQQPVLRDFARRIEADLLLDEAGEIGEEER